MLRPLPVKLWNIKLSCHSSLVNLASNQWGILTRGITHTSDDWPLWYKCKAIYSSRQHVSLMYWPNFNILYYSFLIQLYQLVLVSNVMAALSDQENSHDIILFQHKSLFLLPWAAPHLQIWRGIRKKAAVCWSLTNCLPFTSLQVLGFTAPVQTKQLSQRDNTELRLRFMSGLKKRVHLCKCKM